MFAIDSGGIPARKTVSTRAITSALSAQGSTMKSNCAFAFETNRRILINSSDLKMQAFFIRI
jgi:hypothetical protein